MMIATNDRVQLPPKIDDCRTGKDKLNNFLVDYMTGLEELRFSRHEVSMQ